jgi:hypothetical protein
LPKVETDPAAWQRTPSARRLRPWPLLLPQLLELPRELQHAEIVEALADDLQPDGKPAPV